MNFTPPWWTHMIGCMDKAKELGVSYEELMNNLQTYIKQEQEKESN